GYLGNGSEPWEIPPIESLPNIEVKFRTDPEGFFPYLRDEQTLARPWAIPGTPGLEHRIGGIEKQHITGNVNYEPDNHDFMVRLRAGRQSAGPRVGFDLRLDHDRGRAFAGKRRFGFERTPALPEPVPEGTRRHTQPVRESDHPRTQSRPARTARPREVSG